VANFPSDISPGPDGFNTNFVKKCWQIIKHHFCNLCIAFHSGSICLESLNGSHITLIPKVDGPSKVSDYRPNSLLNTSIKILTNKAFGQQITTDYNEVNSSKLVWIY
jgi:hypothetical protein